ncbi:hypothetical protein [Streptomyces sp. NPDC102476]|uniref:hypothetical protein n=1 Tax=Streptomyces sp. NPDC102476 TaxID=3366181 RepID=UPI00380ED4E6
MVTDDWLSKLALRYLGDASRYPEIYKANAAVIEAAAREHPEPPVFGTSVGPSGPGHWIFPGTVLTIPGATCAPATQEPSLAAHKCEGRGLLGTLLNSPCPPVSRHPGGLVDNPEFQVAAAKCIAGFLGGKLLTTTLHHANILKGFRYRDPAGKVAVNTFAAWAVRTRADGVKVRVRTIVEIFPKGGCVSWLVPADASVDFPLPVPPELQGLLEE